MNHRIERSFLGSASRNRLQSNRAWTLLELLVSITLIILLALLVVSISGALKKRAEKVKCISQMRTIHGSLGAHLIDKGSWPQLPTDLEMTESEFFRFWIQSLEPYGSAEDTWRCPSDKIYFQNSDATRGARRVYSGTYVPTPFDANPSTPMRWNQPWLIERGDFHGKGGHIMMPDGSISEATNPFHGR